MPPQPWYRSALFKFSIFVLFILCATVIGWNLIFKLDYYKALLDRVSPVISGFIFILLYVGLTFFIWIGPKDVMRMVGALLYGAYGSTLFVTIAEMINAIVLFHFSRNMGRAFIVEKAKLFKKDFDQGEWDPSVLGILALRINPLFPLRFLDLGYGLTRVPFKKYYRAVLLSTPFRVFLIQYMLAAVGLDFFYQIAERGVMPLFRDPFLLYESLEGHYPYLLYSVAYVLAVGVISIIAMVAKGRDPKKSAIPLS